MREPEVITTLPHAREFEEVTTLDLPEVPDLTPAGVEVAKSEFLSCLLSALAERPSVLRPRTVALP